MTWMTVVGQAAQAATDAAPAAGESHLLIAYAIFVLFVLGLLALDLGVFHRNAHEVSFKEAMSWSVVWITLGVLFAGVVYLGYENHWLGLGRNVPIYNPEVKTNPAAELIVRGDVGGFEAGKQYLTGYVVEKSLAMDNIFVIAIIFSYFAIPAKFQHRVLFWGIIGALVMRGAMIGIAGQLVANYMWVLIIFGAFLLLTSLKMAIASGHSDPGKNPIVRLVGKVWPVHDRIDSQRFFVRIDGRRAITPLFLALIMVEITDLVFAVDSIPAIFAITPDPFIVFTSNIFAILGLRALYFCLAALIQRFRYLKPALVLILAFVGVKLLLLSVPPYLHWVGLEPAKSIKIDTSVSMAVVLGLLALATVASILNPSKPAPESSDGPIGQGPEGGGRASALGGPGVGE